MWSAIRWTGFWSKFWGSCSFPVRLLPSCSSEGTRGKSRDLDSWRPSPSSKPCLYSVRDSSLGLPRTEDASSWEYASGQALVRPWSLGSLFLAPGSFCWSKRIAQDLLPVVKVLKSAGPVTSLELQLGDLSRIEVALGLWLRIVGRAWIAKQTSS